MTIERFLEEQNHGYDFTEDWKAEDKETEAYKKYIEMFPLEKYFTYKMSDTNKKPGKDYEQAIKYWEYIRENFAEKREKGVRYYCIDPDTYSSLLQEIYKKLWDKKVLEICSDRDDRIHGDTMNSVTTTISKCFRYLYEDEEKYYGSKIENGFVNEKGHPYEGSLSQSLEIYYFERDAKISEAAKKIISASHTIGNFMPVPFENCGGSFNAPRYGATKDYWDLTLKHIYYWYERNSDKTVEMILSDIDKKCDCEDNASLCDLLGKNCANVKLCVKWLCQFEENNNPSWENFVKKNYLEAFVDMDDKDRKPIELWEGHFNQENPLPETLEQCEEFFKNARDRINKRSESMIEKLRKNTANH